MNNIIFSRQAWEEYTSLLNEDKKTIKKINNLLASIQREGLADGIGKPEPLKYRPGYSRRIDETNRLVYDAAADDDIIVLSCIGHYEDK